MIDRHRLSRLADRAVLREHCRHSMKPGIAIEQTWRGVPDFPGVICTMSPGGSGRLIKCLKCEWCGHSVRA